MRSALAWRGILSPYPVGEGLFCADGETRVYSACQLLSDAGFFVSVVGVDTAGRLLCFPVV